MRAAHLKIALFILFLLAPVAALLPFGGIASYGRDRTEFPAVDKLLLGKKDRFDQFGAAVLDRSIVQRMAVQLRTWVGFRLVGFVDNDRLVSGNDGWLFYRPEFTDGRCIDEGRTAARLRSNAVLMEVGRAAGIDVVMTMSPDKSTIYPEALNSMVRGYWKCRIANSATLRRLIKRELPDLIDHTEPLLAEKARHPDIPLYYTTDTHWTPYGGAIALRQLLAAIHPGAQIPPLRLASGPAMQRMDLAGMLLLSIKESGAKAEPLLAADIELAAGDRAAVQTLIIHDSFYVRIGQQIRDAFPDPMEMLSFSQDDRLRVDGVSADRLIINVVERKFVTLEGDVLAWDADLPTALLNRNMRRAQDCGAFGAADVSRDVAVRAVTPGHLPCLRLSVAVAERVDLVIALPDTETGAFEPGRELRYRLEPGAHTVAFVLPAYAAGSNIRLSLDDEDEAMSISAIEVGEIPLPRLASAVEDPAQP